MEDLEALCDRFKECQFVKLYVENEKSPWYKKYCNSNFRQCKRHIYCCNRYQTKGKSLPKNMAPTGSFL